MAEQSAWVYLSAMLMSTLQAPMRAHVCNLNVLSLNAKVTGQ